MKTMKTIVLVWDRQDICDPVLLGVFSTWKLAVKFRKRYAEHQEMGLDDFRFTTTNIDDLSVS